MNVKKVFQGEPILASHENEVVAEINRLGNVVAISDPAGPTLCVVNGPGGITLHLKSRGPTSPFLARIAGSGSGGSPEFSDYRYYVEEDYISDTYGDTKDGYGPSKMDYSDSSFGRQVAASNLRERTANTHRCGTDRPVLVYEQWDSADPNSVRYVFEAEPPCCIPYQVTAGSPLVAAPITGFDGLGNAQYSGSVPIVNLSSEAPADGDLLWAVEMYNRVVTLPLGSSPWKFVKMITVSGSTGSCLVDVYNGPEASPTWDTNSGSHYWAQDIGTGCFHVDDVTPAQNFNGAYAVASQRFRLMDGS